MNLNTPFWRIADELGAIEAELKPFKAKIARAEALRKAIRYEFQESPAESVHTVEGERFVVNVGACGNITVVSTERLLKRITVEKYVSITLPSLRAIEEFCGPSILAECTFQKQIGPRALTVTERVTPVALAAAVKARKREKKAA